MNVCVRPHSRYRLLGGRNIFTDKTRDLQRDSVVGQGLLLSIVSQNVSKLDTMYLLPLCPRIWRGWVYSLGNTQIDSIKKNLIAKKLSVNLKSYREEKELPQSACAQELGIAKATLQKLEKGDPVSSQTIRHVINWLERKT